MTDAEPGTEHNGRGVEWLDFIAGAMFMFLFGYVSEISIGNALIGMAFAVPVIWLGKKTEHRWGNPA